MNSQVLHDRTDSFVRLIAVHLLAQAILQFSFDHSSALESRTEILSPKPDWKGIA